MELSRQTLIVILLVTFVASIVIGFLIGFFGGKNKIKDNPTNIYYESLIQKEDNSFNEKLINEVNADRIRNHLKIMTNKSHMAGTPGDYDSAKYVYDTWVSQKLDYVKLIDYDVLLAAPDPKLINSIEMIDSTGSSTIVNITEPAYDPELGYSEIPRPFLAYSTKGSVSSNRVYYVNYCTIDDFKFMASLNYNLTDSIVLCRYGAIFRGNKVKLAAQYKAKGVLIYEDPIRGAPENEKLYPEGEFLPGDGTQRGSLFTGNGDPLTPMYPSTENAYRIEQSESVELPTIVAQVIGYDNARKIFEMMQGTEVDAKWKGALNVTYVYGGILKNNQKLGVNVYNSRDVKKTWNAIGIIKGATEPDRYVLVGNHRDAWVLGAIDPTSGTASMLEISRVLNELKMNKGWVPKRSIIFMSWGAEEYGLIGSTEWVEEFQKKLSANGVAYLNIDIAVQGSYTFIAKSSPLLFDLIYNVTKTVKLNDQESVYDRWAKYDPHPADSKKPAISSTLGSGSDYMSFQQRIGLACVDATFKQNTKDAKYAPLGGSYPTYHSNYETFRLVDQYIDPGFKSFKAVATVVAELARRLSDSLILPFNCNEYANDLNLLFTELNKTYGNNLAGQNINLNGLLTTVQNFGRAAKRFHDRLSKVDKSKVNDVRQFNDQLKNFEKSFIDPIGIARNGFQHMISAPSLYDNYGGGGFPALSDSIFDALEDKNPANSVKNWKEVKKQLAIVIYVIQSAAYVLDEPTSFERTF